MNPNQKPGVFFSVHLAALTKKFGDVHSTIDIGDYPLEVSFGFRPKFGLKKPN